MNTLEACRSEIDAIDDQLTELLITRMGVVEQVGNIKKMSGREVKDSNREAHILNRISEKVDSDVYREKILHIMRSVFESSRELQKANQAFDQMEVVLEKTTLTAVKAGYAGIPGSFGESALVQYFGEHEEGFNHYPTFSAVCEAVLSGAIDYGILPVENTTTGAIKEVYDLIRDKELYITGEVCLPIVHNLIGLPEANLSDLKEIFSHAQGLEQCTDFLGSLKTERLVPMKNTAFGVRHVAEQKNPAFAAIGGERAAKLYGLEILKPAIQNSTFNMTRFVVLSKKLEVQNNADSTSIVLTAKHAVGALYDILGCFSSEQVNLYRIESRPVPDRPWEYYIYLDAEGSIANEAVKKAIQGVQARCPYAKLLGSYKKGVLI